MKIIYISGPMNGLPGKNFDAFNLVEKHLLKEGYAVINPAKNPYGLKYNSYMDISFAQIRACDFICALPGHQNSPGAIAEIAYGKCIQKQAWTLSKLTNRRHNDL